ncbi:hypothetical protein O181_099760 [Austropuccinia psidii MF-1]|uniref:Uncharacterized protein n=1 Tax=Austropuccinia psidii MF-1 TaxID=1389203 RepID=A0A9Q3PG66_9BASI|nr:hypothetical protein [Austropuccinia psidii MF-1]
MEILHQHQQSQTPKGSPKCDIWDGLVWRCFTGTRNIHNPPFMSIPGALAFSIYVDWFNAVTTMAIHFLGSPYGISSHSSFMANWPYPSPVANMATSSSYGPFMAICVLGPSWPFTSIQHP